ncbi:MAG: alpha/beta hydrolase [Sphingomonadaceae bacterium]|nr:alpha/beta hydrolase [Sphingomonadaceae bacterium]
MPTITSRRGDSLAYARRPGTGPTLVFLPGYMSDMEGGKALAVDAWCARSTRACLRLDYSGCGASGGAFRDGTLTRWRDDVIDVIAAAAPDGPLVLIGSSMGGWLMLLVALTIPARVSALVGIAAAPDFTDWGFGDAQKAAFARGEDLVEPSAYSDEPYVTTAAFWHSGEANRLLDGPIPLTCPVRLLHGQADPDVPWSVSLRLAEALGSADVQTLLVKDGDHRLSRPQDIALLLRVIEDL